MTHSCNTIGQQTTSKVISAAPVLLDGVLIITDGTNAATLTLYDNNSAASGTVVFKAVVAGSVNSAYFPFPNPLRTNAGLYAAVSGTGASYVLYVG